MKRLLSKRVLLVASVVGLLALEAGVRLRAQYPIYKTTLEDCNLGGGQVGDPYSCSVIDAYVTITGTFPFTSLATVYQTITFYNLTESDYPAPNYQWVCDPGTVYYVCIMSSTANACSWTNALQTCSNGTSTTVTSLMYGPLFGVVQAF